MELQHFINENNDYIHQFKEHKLFVRKYSQKGLCIVKGHYKRDYDYKNNPWIKYCRGAVIDINTHKVICIPPEKAQTSNIIDLNHSGKIVYIPTEKLHRVKNIDEVINNFDEKNEYQALVDGTMVNMFYHNDEWMISTRSNIGAKNSWDGKQSFLKMFLEINGSDWLEDLNKEYCYSFLLHHVNNRNVSPIDTNCIFLIENHHISNGEIKKVELQEIPNILNIYKITKEQLYSYNTDIFYGIKGFTIKTPDGRINWINPNYEYVKDLKMNHNDKYLNYISLKQKRLLTQYLTYFPEDRFLFDKYRDEFNHIKMILYERYVSRFISKKIETKDIEYPLKPLVYELHEHYKNNGEKINLKIVSDYMHNLDGKRMMFIINHLKSE